MEYLDIVLLKDLELNRDIISDALYYSFDSASNIGKNSDISLLKAYDKYEKIDYIYKNLGEGFKELKAIVKVIDKKIFIRIVIDNDDLIYDILAYSIFDDNTYDKYKKIFFTSNKIMLDKYLENIKESILIYDGKDLIFVKNANSFLANIKFEDWDFNNKHYSKLNHVMENDIKDMLNLKKDFTSSITYICNGGDKITLNTEFKYYHYNNDFYIIKSI